MGTKSSVDPEVELIDLLLEAASFVGSAAEVQADVASLLGISEAELGDGWALAEKLREAAKRVIPGSVRTAALQALDALEHSPRADQQDAHDALSAALYPSPCQGCGCVTPERSSDCSSCPEVTQ
jgi:hypothetical protein